MNKIRSFENTFPFYPGQEKTRRGKNIFFCSRGKNESCAEYTPLLVDCLNINLFGFENKLMPFRNGKIRLLFFRVQTILF